MVSIVIAGALLGESLKEYLRRASPGERIPVIVYLKQQPDYASFLKSHPTKAARRRDVKRFFSEVKRLARTTQAPLLSYLASLGITEYRSFWINNAVAFSATPEQIAKVAEREEVLEITLDRKLPLPPVRQRTGDIRPDAVASWGISKIKADSVWINLGFTGHGVLIGSMDTGVMADHPALVGKVAHWYDPFGGSPTPTDDGDACVFHGTHTIGTMVGGDGPDAFDEDIGVAPGARVAAVKIFGLESGSCVTYYSTLTDGFQKFVEWKVDSGYNIVAVNNSWGNSDTADLWFWDKVMAWRSADIIPVFANGNEGPNPRTANTPGNYPIVIGVGATDNGDNVADFSSRGPAPDTTPWTDTTYWPRSDWNRIKPNLSAPGVSIYSSVGSNDYALYDGTSMATPHVTATIALMYERNPDLDFSTVYNILLDSSDHYGDCASYPNNDCGWGRLNAYRAVLGTPPAPYPHVVKVHTTVDDGAGDGDGRPDPGETFNLAVTLRNVGGADATGVSATLVSLYPSAHIVDGSSSFGTIAPMDTVNNSTDPFVVRLDSSALVGQYAVFNLIVSYNSGTYSDTFTLYFLIGNPIDMIVIDTGTATLGISALTGGIGFHKPDTTGPGFVFPEGGDNLLTYAGVAFGNSPDYLVDSWITNDLSHYWGGVLWDNPRIGDQHGSAGYTDADHPLSKGMRLDVDAYAYDAYRPNWVFLRYKLINEGTSTVSGLYLGIFADFQMPGWSASEAVAVDSALNIAYVYDEDSTYPYAAGVAIVSDAPIANLGSFNQTNFYGLPDDSTKWAYLNGTIRGESCPVDCGVIASTGPFTLTPGDTVSVTFAFVGLGDIATGERELAKVVPPKVSYSVEEKGITLKVLSAEGVPITAKLYSPSGRLVSLLYSGPSKGKNVFRLKSLPIGVYILSVEVQGRTFIRRLVVR